MAKTVAGRGKARWEQQTLEPALKRAPERAAAFTTISGRPVERLYASEDVEDVDYARDLADPGDFPYTRGIHPTGYRGKLWTMRQFAGFCTAADTNKRFRYLLSQGQTGLSVAFDLPTLYGYDSTGQEVVFSWSPYKSEAPLTPPSGEEPPRK